MSSMSHVVSELVLHIYIYITWNLLMSNKFLLEIQIYLSLLKGLSLQKSAAQLNKRI